MKKWILFSIFLSFISASNLLVINDNADSAYFGQFEEILNELGFVHDSWNVQADGTPTIVDGITHLIIYGNGTTLVPAVAGNDDPLMLADWLDDGGNLLLIDQNLFISNDVASGTALQIGDFAHDYLGVSSANTDHGIDTLNSLIGPPFTFQNPLVMDFTLYHTENSSDFLTPGLGSTGLYRTYPGNNWVALHNENNSFETIFLSFAADAIVKEDCGGAWYTDCIGTEFDNDDGIYTGYDCVIDDGNCCDQDGDGEIFDWLGDGYCDDGTYEFVFQCDEYSWDCDDCPDLTGPDPNGYCDRDSNYRIKDRIPAINHTRDHANVTWDDKLSELLVFLIGELEVPSAPFIHEISGPSGFVNNFYSQDVSLTATDFNGDSFTSQIEYSVNGAEMSPIIMSTANDTLFLGVVPGQNELGAEVSYKIVLTDDSGYSSESAMFYYEIFNVTSNVLMVYNDSEESSISEAGYLSGSLDFDFWIGGVSDVQLANYSTVFEIAPYWSGNYTDHLSLINNWLDEGNNNYFLAGDDVLYLIGLSGANLETPVEEISTASGNPDHSDLFTKMGIATHFNDLHYLIDSVEYGYSDTPFELVPDESDAISGAVFDHIAGSPLIYDPYSAFGGLYNYLDGIITGNGGTPIFYTGYTGSTEEDGFDQSVATGVHKEWENGSKSVYLGFNPYALYNTVDDSLHFIGGHFSNPIKQAAEWFGLDLSIGEQISSMPLYFKLENNFPNPFNPETVINYSISTPQMVKLTIHNLLGREVDVLVDKQMTAGDFSVIWAPKNMSSGAYFARLQVGEMTQTLNMIYLK